MNSYNPICFPTLDSLLSQPTVIGQNAVIKQPVNHVKQRLAEAAEQLKLVNSLCVCGKANMQNTSHREGDLGVCSPRKIFFKFACSEIESGAIWRHLKPSTHILAYVSACMRRCVRRCVIAPTTGLIAAYNFKLIHIVCFFLHKLIAGP